MLPSPRAALGLLLALFACSVPLQAQTPPVKAPPRPNIIIILADDLGFSDVGCYGGEIHTPNIDSLAHDGLSFTQFYNASKCQPSRASLLSGLYWQEARQGIQRGITIAQALHAAGYVTLASGKWHLAGNPVDRGFDHWFGFLHGATNYFRGDEFFRLDHAPYQPPASGFYTTDAFTDYALRFLADAHQQTPDKPFFLYLAYNAPHSPLQALPEDIARYRDTYTAGWDALRQMRYQRQLALGIIRKEWALSPRPDDIPAWDSLSTDARRLEAARMAVYAAMIDRMDQGIGRLLAKLKEWRIEDNTLVIFLSDNGANPYDMTADRSVPVGGADSNWAAGLGWANLSNTPFRFYKRYQHEGGVATPFIVRWPAVIKRHGTLTDQPAHVVDLMATCVELSGCDYAQVFRTAASTVSATDPDGEEDPPPAAPSVTPSVIPMAGISLTPLLRGQPWHGHDALYFQFFNHRAIRAGNWELVSHDGKPWELYPLDTDRTELHDLAARQPEKVNELQAIFDRWWNRADLQKKIKASEEPVYIDPTTPPDKLPPRHTNQPIDDD